MFKMLHIKFWVSQNVLSPDWRGHELTLHVCKPEPCPRHRARKPVEPRRRGGPCSGGIMPAQGTPQPWPSSPAPPAVGHARPCSPAGCTSQGPPSPKHASSSDFQSVLSSKRLRQLPLWRSSLPF